VSKSLLVLSLKEDVRLEPYATVCCCIIGVRFVAATSIIDTIVTDPIAVWFIIRYLQRFYYYILDMNLILRTLYLMKTTDNVTMTYDDLNYIIQTLV
jgi:hypothetical protein